MAEDGKNSEGDSDSMAAISIPTRWICEACGCHTNTEENNSGSCGVCGTRRTASISRRRAARISLGRSFHPNNNGDMIGIHEGGVGDNEEENMRSNRNDEESNNNADAVALLMAGVTDAAIPFRTSNVRSTRRLLRTNSGSNSFNPLLRQNAVGRNIGRTRRSDRIDQGYTNRSTSSPAYGPEELLFHAIDNSIVFNPKWSINHKAPSIIVDGYNHPHVAYVAEGGDEGGCIRAAESIPKTTPEEFHNLKQQVNENNGTPTPLSRQDQKTNNIFGWKIVFDHFSHDRGKNMGGCYLAGVTTSAFSSFTERNGLQHSQQFWGIEDCGRKYEGSSILNRQNNTSASNNIQLGIDTLRNSDNVLFGSREVIIIVADLNARTLTYWRDSVLLGTLITGLPRSSILYPIVVPFNIGVSVSIVGMNCDPISILSEFQISHRLALQAKYESRRKALSEQRSILIKNDDLSHELTMVLRTIFSWYDHNSNFGSSIPSIKDLTEIKLNASSAAQLWYRCGFSLSNLRLLLQSPTNVTMEESLPHSRFVSSDCFIDLIRKIVKEELNLNKNKTSLKHTQEFDPNLASFNNMESTDANNMKYDSLSIALGPNPPFEIRDRVEVAEGFERYGDAASGPLMPGDRGTVTEVQSGPHGNRQSVRVSFNGRRWWYQPSALVSERSGLLQSPAVRFLCNLLRAHGYDSNLQPLWGTPVAANTCVNGDLVLPDCSLLRDSLMKGRKRSTKDLASILIGRIVTEKTPSQRNSGLVAVNFAGSKSAIKRVDPKSLIYTTFYHGSRIAKLDFLNQDISHLKGSKTHTFHFTDSDDSHVSKTELDGPELLSSVLSPNMKKSETDLNNRSNASSNTNLSKIMAGIAKLDKEAIGKILKDCKSSASLARMFSAGLPSSILSAINYAVSNEIEASSIKSLGLLINTVMRQLFRELSMDENSLGVASSVPNIIEEWNKKKDENLRENNTLESSNRPPSNSRSNSTPMYVRDLIRDLGIGADQRRGVLLTLMANNDTRTNLNHTSIEDLQIQNGNHFLSPFDRFDTETAAFGLSTSHQPIEPFDDNHTQLKFASSNTPLRESQTMLESTREGKTRATSLQKSTSAHLTLNSATRSLIYDGILLNNIFWVKKALKLGANATSFRDEDGHSVLQLAIMQGCSDSILCALIVSGACVREQELQEAAFFDQPSALSLLLNHSIYIEGTIDKNICSERILFTLNEATSKQKLQVDNMYNMSTTFAIDVFKKLLILTLKYQVEKAHANLTAAIEVLVGYPLLYSMHISQFHGTTSESNRENQRFDNAHISNNQGSSSIFSDTLSEIFDSRVIKKGTESITSSHGSFSSLIDILPPCILSGAFANDSNQGSSSMLTYYFRLTETLLWSKEMQDASTGLILVYTLLKKTPQLCNEMNRYGIKDLASSHILNADRALSEIYPICTSNNTSQMENSSINTNTKSKNCFIIKCPKNHHAMLHLTRHSQFKCDLCGRGVEQNKPMHGCRQCDWDACEKCTDKAEGGMVKWRYIRSLATKCLLMLRKIDENGTTNAVNNDLEITCERIRMRKMEGIQNLHSMLNTPGKITLHEFSSHVLRSLHQVFIYENDSRNFFHLVNGNHHQHKRRRTKKQRIGYLLSKENYIIAEQKNELKGDDELAAGLGCTFVDNAAKVLLSPYTIDGENDHRSFFTDKEFVNEAIDFEIDKSETKEIDEDPIDDTPDDNESSDYNSEEDEINASNTPIILHYLHSILAFHEQMAISRNVCRITSDNRSNGGDLQTLLQPFQIILKKSKSNSKICTYNTDPHNQETYSDLNGAMIHVEPLMSIHELKMHILRCTNIKFPSYVEYCKRLAQDRAIIVERCTKICDSNSGERDKITQHRFARVLGFDESTAVHRICYASRVSSYKNNLSVSEEEKNQRNGQNLSNIHDIEFDNRDVLVILAAKDYRVLRREQVSREDFSHHEIVRENIDIIHEAQQDTTPSMLDNYIGSSNVNALNFDNMGELYMLPKGIRIESDINTEQNGKVEPFTILSCYMGYSSDMNSGFGTSAPRYNIVSDAAEVFIGVSGTKIKGHDAYLKHQGQSMNSFNNHTQNTEDSELRSSHQLHSLSKPSVLRRTWSALSPIRNMKPFNLNSTRCADEDQIMNADDKSWRKRTRKLSFDGNTIEIDANFDALEKPPLLNVKFSFNDGDSTTALENSITVFSGLQSLSLQDKQPSCNLYLAEKRTFTLFYSIDIEEDSSKAVNHINSSLLQEYPLPRKFLPPWTRVGNAYDQNRVVNSYAFDSFQTKQSSKKKDNMQTVSTPDGEHDEFKEIAFYLGSNEKHNTWDNGQNIHSSISSSQCEFLNETCIQCLDILGILSENDAAQSCAETKNEQNDYSSNKFVSKALTHKLLEQLEDPLLVVGGALPDWCRIAPCLAPRVFSHICRRRLMECAAFGVSRSVLKQQETKIAVGPLRQKMAALRGRAVELVGEAFSGGASDPTALQLQADELYAMEDALANRINAAFRAQRWEEHSLQSAKAVVRRNFLLKDAAAVMETYSSDSRAKQRRLEVRFDGESGFDAASGDEAGVTRGFYADVADALLSCDHAEVVFPSFSRCLDDLISEVDSSTTSFKLPLWIPDTDPSGKVVIPTPRADPKSQLGVYPRPLSISDPIIEKVLQQFRFIGRLFAAALRDGFVFPLPLSSSFLKLAQYGYYQNIEIGLSKDQASTSNIRYHDNIYSNSHSSSGTGEFSPYNSYSPSPQSSSNPQTHMSIDEIYGDTNNSNDQLYMETSNISRNDVSCDTTESIKDMFQTYQHVKGNRLLNSLDLPRPGFLGGEIFAVEKYICRLLDKLDTIGPTLSDLELAARRNIIATDKTFARTALGKSYDCSFEDYFLDRSFVDPLDPSQGKNAAQLCRNGDSIPVTINNVRDWVYLSKRFFLYDGVISQAMAFRQGINDFFSVNVLSLFTAKELHRDVCGGGDTVDRWDESSIRSLFKLDGGEGAAEALVAVVAMGGEGGAALSRRFGPSSPTIGFLVRALMKANVTERRQFLSFVTSVPIVTPGQIEVVPIVNPAGEFLPMSDPSCLPRSNTCARRLYLPKFENFEIFSQVLWSVVREECRFKGFFEWRG